MEKVVWEWEHVNKFKPVWTRKPADVTDQEYIDLYQAISGDSDKPLGKIHFSAEGDVAFKAVLFIPKRPPPDFFHGEFSAKSRLKVNHFPMSFSY